MPHVSVILPTHNPHPGRFAKAIAALHRQTLPTTDWELVVIDNASTARGTFDEFDLGWHPSARVVHESKPGLTTARLCGIRAARGELLVFVDDDNVLGSDFLAHAAAAFETMPRLGAAGGIISPEWETSPPTWLAEFGGLLALRDFGAETNLCRGGAGVDWPEFAPVGAGLCLRRAAAETYVAALAANPAREGFDRTGSSLASGGDCDLVFTALHAGWDVAYLPQLRLVHLISARRLEPAYLGRLNQGIMRSWVSVLALHGQCPWKPIAPPTVPLRVARAGLRHAPWRSAAHYIRWRGAIGQFQGQADLFRASR